MYRVSMRVSCVCVGVGCLLFALQWSYTNPLQISPPTPPTPTSTVQESYYNQTESSCDCLCGQYGRKMRIVGGEETDAHEFPWIVYLSYRGKFYCGGTLLTQRHVLTAAHCTQQIRKEYVEVTLGEHNRMDSSATVETRRVKRISAHKDFTLATFKHDIAVLELDKPVTFVGSVIRPACLPDTDDEDYTGRSATVVGWGRLSERKKTSDTLQKVSVPIMSQEDCKTQGYPASKISDQMICAGFPEGEKDACQGDSGGPLHSKDANNVTEVIGIVSWGRGCARPKFPGIYTRVASYMDWLEDKLDGECRCTRRPGPRTPRNTLKDEDWTESAEDQPWQS